MQDSQTDGQGRTIPRPAIATADRLLARQHSPLRGTKSVARIDQQGRVHLQVVGGQRHMPTKNLDLARSIESAVALDEPAGISGIQHLSRRPGGAFENVADADVHIDDPEAAAAWQNSRNAGAEKLRVALEEREEWLAETIPPPAYAEFHASMKGLATLMQRNADYAEQLKHLVGTFRGANRAKIRIMERGAQDEPFVDPWQRRRSGGLDVIFRPFGLPITYNLSTGQWNASVVIPLPIGVVTIALPTQPGETQGLLKIMVDNEARYFATRPGVKVSFPEEHLKFESLTFEKGSVQVLQLRRIAPIVRAAQRVGPSPTAPIVVKKPGGGSGGAAAAAAESE